jgi:signal transduction histidine kinase
MKSIEGQVKNTSIPPNQGSSDSPSRSAETRRLEYTRECRDTRVNAKLRQAQRLARIGYWERDLLTDRITFSGETLQILGVPSQTGSMSLAELETFIHPADLHRQRTAICAALEGAGPYDVECRILRPDGTIRCVHVWEEAAFDRSDRPVRMFGTVQDITERRQAEERRRQSSARMQVLARVSKALAECRLDVQEELTTITELTMSVIGDGCILMLLSPDGRTLQAVAQRHRDPEASEVLDQALPQVPIHNGASSGTTASRSTQAPIIDAQSGWNVSVLRSGTGELLPTLNPEEVKQRVHPGLRQFVERIEIHSLLSVPLRSEENLLGILTLYRSSPGRPYTPDDQVLLQDLADRAALLIRNAHLLQKYKSEGEKLEALSRRLVEVEEEERRSLARGLHDGIGQMLTVVKLKVEAARESGEIEEVRTRFAEIITTIEKTLDAVRSMALDLRPAILDDLGLEAAIRWYLERQSRGLGIRAELTAVSVEKRPPPEVELACFRVLQELWTNTLRHAAAHRFSVELCGSNEEFVMRVCDDGKGFSVDEAEDKALRGQSMGLVNIRERVAQLGGSVDIHSAPGKGTTTTVRTSSRAGGGAQ